MNEYDDRLLKWFQLASLAPSAANMQPWSYKGKQLAQGYEITLKISPEFLAAPSALDPYFATATIAIGCFATNLEIAANLDGYKCTPQKLNGKTASNWEWKFKIELAQPAEVNLFCSQETLYKRVSNREAYVRTPVDPTDIQAAKILAGKNSEIKLIQIGSRRAEWARALSTLESIRLKQDHLRAELFTEFKTEKEILCDPVGLPIRTVSNSWLLQMLIFFMKKFPIFQLPLKYGASGFFSWLSLSRPLFFSGEIFALQINETDPSAGVNLGKTLEELWLLWTHLGYSVQVIALPILVYGNREGLLGKTVSKTASRALDQVRKQAQEELSMDLSLMTLFLRVGRAKSTTPNSPRRKVTL